MPSALKKFDHCQLCVSLAEENFPALLNQIKKAAMWADLIEIRLDKLKDFDFNLLKSIEKQTLCSIIWTLRKTSQGGAFQGSEDQRFNILNFLLSFLQPAFVDIEADTPVHKLRQLQDVSPQTQWIVSWHDDEETPSNLSSLYQKLTQHDASYYKIVTKAHSTIDCLRMVNFSRKINHDKRNFCGLCSGERGQFSRILGPLLGSPFTYACLEKGKETASGQLTAEEIVNTYRFRDMNRSTQLLGLIGRPVNNSLSHLTHNSVLHKLSLNAIYLKFHLEDFELCQFFKEISLLPILGLSVTMPFKEKILPFLDNSHNLSSCNTLVFTGEGVMGFNTDGLGAIKALGRSSLKGEHIVILGAGGTAQAIAQEAYKKGAKLTILNRTVDRAKVLAQSLNAQWGSLHQLSQLKNDSYRFIIQATSVGMKPAIHECPVTSESISKEACLLEVISNPPETQLLYEIRKRGGQTIAGLELFIHQATEQFRCWFGEKISKKEVEETIRFNLPPSQQRCRISVTKSHLKGNVKLPPSKSHTIRAILLAAMCKGTSFLYQLLDSKDSAFAIQAACQLGAKVESLPNGLAITGVAGFPQTPDNVINAGNSGLVLRITAALASLSEGYTVITGDESIRSNRPVQPLIEGLKGLNGWAISTRENGYAPLIVKGPLQPGFASLIGHDSQPVSALLMAASFIEGESMIQVNEAGEKPWLNVTLSWLDRLGVEYQHKNLEHFTIQGKRKRNAFKALMPGDLSALAFPLAAALITRSEIQLQGVDIFDIQGDKEVIFLLQRMGAHLEIDAPQLCLTVFSDGNIKGQKIDVNGFIDAVPILAVMGCYAAGETHLINAKIARYKESNRLKSIVTELKKMGAEIDETEDGVKILNSQLKGANVESHGDHRIAMSLIVAGLGAEGVTYVCDTECISKSYPLFVEDLRRLGALINEDTRQEYRDDRLSIFW